MVVVVVVVVAAAVDRVGANPPSLGTGRDGTRRRRRDGPGVPSMSPRFPCRARGYREPSSR
jgi:hypothetical protein